MLEKIVTGVLLVNLVDTHTLKSLINYIVFYYNCMLTMKTLKLLKNGTTESNN